MSIPVSKTLAEIRTDLFTRINAVQAEYYAKGYLPRWLSLNQGVFRGLIELWAWGLYQLYSFLSAILAQAFPESATGSWLDLHCAQVGVTRLQATKATGTVVFYRTGTTGNVPIPAGRIVRTLPDGLGNVYRFTTTAAVVLQDGQTEVEAEVLAEEYGAASNVTTGQISQIVTPVTGVEGVRNDADWLTSEGADREDDDSLRERYYLAWADVGGATKYAYESWARSVSGVVSATILDQHPRGQGTVDVVIRGTAGIPTQELIDAVDAIVQVNRPINDDALVKAPDSVSVDIAAELELTSGSPTSILSTVEDRIQALFSPSQTVSGITPLEVGEDLTLDRLVSVMMVTGVRRIVWPPVSADVTVPQDGLAVLNSITLTYTWASEA